MPLDLLHGSLLMCVVATDPVGAKLLLDEAAAVLCLVLIAENCLSLLDIHLIIGITLRIAVSVKAFLTKAADTVVFDKLGA